MSEQWLQVTAGQGPAECAWAVREVVGRLCAEAEGAGVVVRLVEDLGESVLLAVEDEAFAGSWVGTVQWVGRSPFRPEHKRKNWFVGITALAAVEETRFDARDVRWETMRASGPGGQHVNRTESAVRVTHLPSGAQATAAEERSQFRNRKLALARLAARIAELQEGREGEARRQRWQAHQKLERGNPVRVFRA